MIQFQNQEPPDFNSIFSQFLLFRFILIFFYLATHTQRNGTDFCFKFSKIESVWNFKSVSLLAYIPAVTWWNSIVTLVDSSQSLKPTSTNAEMEDSSKSKKKQKNNLAKNFLLTNFTLFAKNNLNYLMNFHFKLSIKALFKKKTYLIFNIY